MILLGLSGPAGVGKDTMADHLVLKHGFRKLALADPLKEVCKFLFNFSHEQLWGPSDARNAVDAKWGFSPRSALQLLGTEFGRALRDDLWIRVLLEKVERAQEAEIRAWKSHIQSAPGLRFVVPDVRFRNELEAIRAAGGSLVRLRRGGLQVGVGIPGHASEEEQKQLGDEDFDAVLEVPSGLEVYRAEIDKFIAAVAV